MAESLNSKEDGGVQNFNLETIIIFFIILIDTNHIITLR